MYVSEAAVCYAVLHNNHYTLLLEKIIIIIIFHHEFRPGWPVSVSAVISSSSLLSGLPGHRLPFG
jgi:hypothetical protein